MFKSSNNSNENQIKDNALRILIIDDSEDDALLVIRALKEDGYNPVYERVETAAAMKKTLKGNQWDVIICDYKMPKFDAPSAIFMLKKAYIDVPLIIISGAIGEETAVECMRLGARDYIMKSNLSRLCPAIARELEEAKVRKKQKKAEEDLNESEEKHRFLSDQSIMGMIIIQKGYVKYVNYAIAKITGYSIEEMMNLKPYGYSILLHPDESSYVMEQARRKQTGDPDIVVNYVWRIITKSGEVKWVESFSRTISYEGSPADFVMMIDITERKRIEEELRKSELVFRSLFEASPIGIFTLKDRKYVQVNPAMCRTTGYLPEDLILQSVRICYRDDKEYERAGEKIYSQIMREGVGFIEARLKRRNGEEFDALICVNPIDPQDHSSGYEGIMVDITERKQIEEKYRSIFENAQEGIFRSTPGGIFIMANQSMARMLGYDSPEDLINGLTDIVRQLYVDFKERTNLIKMVEQQGFAKNHEARFYRKDGRIIWVSITIMPTRDEKGQIQYFEGIAEDITDRKRAEEEIRHTQEQMRAFASRLQVVREEERTRIAREIHDELGGALTGIKIDFSLLTKATGEIKDESLKHLLLYQMHNTMKQIDKTIRTVRKIATELRPGILDDLGILAALEWQLNDFQKHTGIHCEWVSSMEEINLDEQGATALFRIFQEALTNVARHAGATALRVHLRKEADIYVLDVKDNGRGITKNDIDNKKSLGLLGMRERTLAFGGRIEVKGHPGRGTKVTVEIPLKKPDNKKCI